MLDGNYISSLSVVFGCWCSRSRAGPTALSSTLGNPVDTRTSGNSGLHYDTTSNQIVYTQQEGT
jgi:hypothetical protein